MQSQAGTSVTSSRLQPCAGSPRGAVQRTFLHRMNVHAAKEPVTPRVGDKLLSSAPRLSALGASARAHPKGWTARPGRGAGLERSRPASPGHPLARHAPISERARGPAAARRGRRRQVPRSDLWGRAGSRQLGGRLYSAQ